MTALLAVALASVGLIGLGPARPRPADGAAGTAETKAHASSTPAPADLPGRGWAWAATWSLPPRPLPFEPLFEPLDLALMADGRLLVADAANNAVLVFDAEGRLSERWTLDDQPGTRACAASPIALAAGTDSAPVRVLWALHEPADAPSGMALLETRGADGERLGAQGVEASDLALDPLSDDLYLLDAEGGRLRLLAAGDPVPRDFAPVDRTRGQGGALALGPTRIAVLAAGGAVDLLSRSGGRLARIDPRPHRARAVALGLDDQLWLLAQADARAAAEARPILLRYGAEAQPLEALGPATLGGQTLPALAWPFTLDLRGPWLALTGVDEAGAFGIRRYRDLSADGPTLRGGAARPRSPASRCAASRPDAPLRLASAADGRIEILDGPEAQTLTLGPDGPLFQAPAPPDAVELALGPDGARYLLGSGGALERQTAAGDRVWRVDCACPWSAGLALSGDRVLVAEPWPAPGRVAVFAAEDGRRLGSIGRQPPGAVWPSDLAPAPDGRLFGADLLAGMLTVIPAAAALGTLEDPELWPTGPRGSARRLDAGLLAPGLPGLGLLRADDRVAILAGLEGQLAGLVRPTDGRGAPIHAADLALGDAGRLYLVEPRVRSLHLLEPRPDTEPGQPDAPPAVERPACRLRAERRVRPRAVAPGEAAEVSLRIETICPGASDIDLNLVLVVDRSASMQGLPLAAAKRVAQALGASLGGGIRLALVTFDRQATVQVRLTRNHARVPAVLAGIEAEGGTDIAAGIRRAEALLREAALTEPGGGAALPMILLLTDGARSRDTEDPRAAALAARARGVQLLAAGMGPRADLRLLADLAGGRLLDTAAGTELGSLRAHLAALTARPLPGDLILDEGAGEGYGIAPGSGSPAALTLPGGLRWGRAVLPAEGLTLTYAIRPEATGQLTIGAVGNAAYADGRGLRHALDIAPATLLVLPPSPTPSPVPPATAPSPLPSATAPGPGASPSPPPDPRPHRAFLPALDRCGDRAPSDLVLVLDASTSMQERFGAASKLEAVVDATGLVWSALRLGAGDRAAVLSFNREARLHQALTADRAALEAALRGIPVAAETRIDLGIAAAMRLGAGQGPGRAATLILVTDGRPYPVSAEVVLAQAEAAKAAGFRIRVLGLGAELDPRTLLGLASRPEDARQARDPAALRAAMDDFARSIACGD